MLWEQNKFTEDHNTTEKEKEDKNTWLLYIYLLFLNAWSLFIWNWWHVVIKMHTPQISVCSVSCSRWGGCISSQLQNQTIPHVLQYSSSIEVGNRQKGKTDWLSRPLPSAMSQRINNIKQQDRERRASVSENNNCEHEVVRPGLWYCSGWLTGMAVSHNTLPK